MDQIDSDFDSKSDIKTRLGYLIGLSKLKAYYGQKEAAISIIDTKISGHFPDEVVTKIENEILQILT